MLERMVGLLLSVNLLKRVLFQCLSHFPSGLELWGCSGLHEVEHQPIPSP